MNKDIRVKVVSTFSSLTKSSTELDHTGGRIVLDIITNAFNSTTDFEPLAPSSASGALESISNVMEVAITNNTFVSDVSRITNTIKNIGKLVMIDKASGQNVFLVSKKILFSQSRELVENVVEKTFSTNETESSFVRFYQGTFDHVPNTQRMISVDIQLILWNQESRNMSSFSEGISSDVLSCTLIDNEGKDITIEKVGKDPIDITIYSPYITSSSTCKYFDEKEVQWKDVPVKERVLGKSIICSTPHLTDFAVFNPFDEQHMEWDRNLLWLLMILLLIPIVGFLVAGIIILKRRMDKRKVILKKHQELDNVAARELQAFI